MTIDERVKNGAAYLDETVPDWRTRVNERLLDIGCCYNCVLGQLYGDYHIGVKRLDLTPAESADRGLRAALELEGRTVGDTFGEFPALTAAWRRVLER